MDQVLFAVEELVNGGGGVSGQLSDPSQRAVAQTVLAEDPFAGVEDIGRARGAPGGASPAARVVVYRIGHDLTLANTRLDLMKHRPSKWTSVHEWEWLG